MALRAELLNSHKWTETANGPDGSDGRLVISEDLLLTVLHELVPVFPPLLAGGDATDLLLYHHVEVFLLLLCLGVQR